MRTLSILVVGDDMVSKSKWDESNKRWSPGLHGRAVLYFLDVPTVAKNLRRVLQAIEPLLVGGDVNGEVDARQVY